MAGKNPSKVVFITGCSSGFGYLTAKKLAMDGHRVYGSMRNVTTKNKEKKDELEQFGKDNGKDLSVIECDVLDDASVKAAVKAVIDDAGRLDVLVNNAGYALYGPIEYGNEGDIEKMFDTNVYGYIRTIRAALPYMREQRSGHIINLSSEMGEIGLPYCGYYNASKFAVVGFSEALLGECYLFNINVSVIMPMGYATDFLGRSLNLVTGPEDSEYEKKYAYFVANINKLVTKNSNPKEVANKIASIIKKKSPPFKVPVGKFARSGLIVKKLVHPRRLQKIIAKLYGLKEWL